MARGQATASPRMGLDEWGLLIGHPSSTMRRAIRSRRRGVRAAFARDKKASWGGCVN